jgi:hypothetical protein
MAQAPQSPGGNDNFIRRIVTDPKNVPDVMLLTGYLGASSEEAHERLYLSADLTNYVEIPNTAILHQAPLPKEQDAHGGVTLWVKKDAALQYKMAPAAQALANYFAGAIQAGAQGAPGGGGAAAEPRASIGVHCATFNCSLHCATEITPCLNTHANTCFCPVTHGCPSQNQLCQSQGQCTYIGCGHSLACTDGLLCAAAVPDNAVPQGAQAAQAMQPTLVAAACPTHLRCTPPFTADFVPCTVTPCTIGNCTIGTPCTIGCTHPPHCFLPNVTHATCFLGCTHPPQCFLPNVTHATCALHCTHVLPCLQKSVPPILCGGVAGAGFPAQPGFGQLEAQAFFSAPAACQTRPEFCNTRIGPACHPM